MALTKLTQDLDIIQTLSDAPNNQDGLTSTQLKAKFDEGTNAIKDYINDTLTAEIDTLNSQNVKITGNQTIAGIKTFTSSPVVPTPTTDMQAATKKYVEDYANGLAPLNIADGSIGDAKLASDIKIGSLAALLTSAKTSVVAAINYFYGLFTGHLADSAITPESYTGNAVQKIQSAIDAALLENRAVKLTKEYNITGLGTIEINKPLAYGRNKFYIISEGGVIKKTDSGIIFTSDSEDTGDIVFENIKFQSTEGAGVKVFDCDKLIRFSVPGCSFVDVDTILYAPTKYIQSVVIDKKTSIVGGNGYAIEYDRCFDLTIANSLVEHRESFIRNLDFANNPDNNTLRIINNVIEGLTGKIAELGSTFGCTIQGNYFEGCTEYLDLDNSAQFHNGLSIKNNTFQLTNAQITADTPAIKLGKIGNFGVHSEANVSTGVLYELSTSGSTGKVASSGDISYTNKKAIGATQLLCDLGTVYDRAVTNGTFVEYGAIKKYSNMVQSAVIGAGAIATVHIDLGIEVTTTDMVSIRFLESGSPDTGRIVNWYGDSTGINVVMHNTSVGSQYFLVYVTVLKII